ncbi:MAG: hypothetical protein Q7J57_14690 [Gemmobacter sp.]|nr:hypothetical protein [Gemmobacter sp.]
MSSLQIINALTLIALASVPFRAGADHWRQTADPQVVQALNELVQIHGGLCQQGNPQACQMLQSVQSHGSMMLNAGYDCQTQGNAQACAWYQQAYAMLSQTYAQTQQAMMQGQFSAAQTGAQYGGGQMPGSTHEDRMRQIQNWGQERLQWGADSSARMDRQHQQFMQTLRE